MENETASEMAVRHSKLALGIRFDLFDAAMDYFLQSYATRLLSIWCGYPLKKPPVPTAEEDFQELENTYLKKLPDEITRKIVEPGRPVCQFPTSDEWMHWLRDNVPEGMELEEFEECVYHSDIYVFKWQERYMNECRQFDGVKLLTNLVVFLLRTFLVLSIYYMATHGKPFAALMCTIFTVASMFVCARIVHEKS